MDGWHQVFEMIRFGKRELNHTCSISSESKYPEKILNACVRSYIYVIEEKRMKEIILERKGRVAKNIPI